MASQPPAHPLPGPASSPRLKTSKAGKLLLPGRLLSLGCHLESPSAFPPWAYRWLKRNPPLQYLARPRRGREGAEGGRANGGRRGRGEDTMHESRKRIQTRVLVLEKKGQA